MAIETLLAQHQGLTGPGWVVMIGCIGFVCCLVTFCFYHVLKGSPPTQDADDQ